MIIDSVDFYYASMPEVTLEADGSQDALLVRVVADGLEGWGECEASPLTSIAAFVTPRSHGVCQPVSASVLGETVNGPDDILRIGRLVGRNSMDLLQAAHTWSGIEIALWDLLGKKRDEPVWRMLGYTQNHAKLPYASMLMGDTPQETLDRARLALLPQQVGDQLDIILGRGGPVGLALAGETGGVVLGGGQQATWHRNVGIRD